METLNQISEALTRLLDYPLGWLLAIHRDIAIVIVALGTSLLLTLARKWTTNQDHLCRCKSDMTRLKQLRREAKRAKNKDAVERIRATVGMISIVKMKAEGLPLLVSIIPIALLAIWCLARLDYFPPKHDAALTVRVYYPHSSVGKYAHARAPKGVELKPSTIQAVRLDPDGEENGLAVWDVRPGPGIEEFNLTVSHLDRTATHQMLVGGNVYPLPLVDHAASTDEKILMSEVVLDQAKFLGVVPGIPEIMFPPWLVAYLIIVVPFVPLLRKVMGVY